MEEKYIISPKGIAVLALLESGLINDIDDPRANGFFTLFEAKMRQHGYVVEDEE